MPVDPTYLGLIQDVTGNTVSVSLDESTLSGLAFIDGQAYRIGQVGSFVRISLGYVNLFGVVSQVGAGAVPERLAAQEPHGYRWMTVQLVGEGTASTGFRRGISQYPTVGDRVYVVTNDDLRSIYGRENAPNFVKVGHLASAESIPALIDVNRLLSRHSAVVGATGAGKSTTVASLLRALCDPVRYQSARILIVDIHGEYGTALRDLASVFRINPAVDQGQENLFVPYWAMSFDELLSITLGTVDDASRGAVLEKIYSLKKEALNRTAREGVTADTLTVDTPVPFSIHRLWFEFHKAMYATHTAQQAAQSAATEALAVDASGQPIQAGDALKVIPPQYQPIAQGRIFLSAANLNFRRPLDYLATKLRDPRFNFMFRPGPWLPGLQDPPEADLDQLLSQWLGGEHPITILDLSGVPSAVLNQVVGVVLRIIYDALFWARSLSEGGRERPILVVLEEAHNYLRDDQSSSAGAAVQRIVKEGRKYGIAAMIVSQRPSEIDPTVLSQCGTMIAMRLSNASDRSHVTSAVTDNLEGLLSMLPVLRTGEAIVVGEAVHLPLRTLLAPPSMDRRPDSADPEVFNESGPGGWNRTRETADYKDVVTVWRKQDPRSPKTIP
jgi:uncharacterized protein